MGIGVGPVIGVILGEHPPEAIIGVGDTVLPGRTRSIGRYSACPLLPSLISDTRQEQKKDGAYLRQCLFTTLPVHYSSAPFYS